jgi:hypothetical protein
VIADQVLVDVIAEAARLPEFGGNAWLTFYLTGSHSNLESMATALKESGASNLDGAQAGFLYAKLPTKLELSELKRNVRNVRSLADQCGVNIDLIDLDSSSDVERSKFITLFKSAN